MLKNENCQQDPRLIALKKKYTNMRGEDGNMFVYLWTEPEPNMGQRTESQQKHSIRVIFGLVLSTDRNLG